MAVNGNFLKIYNMMGNCRNLLSSRVIVPTYQPVATLKREREVSAGLPPSPSRPLTPYFRFIKQIRPSITEKNPNAKMSEITKMVALEWKKADEQLKQKLQEEYNKSKEEYKVAKANHYNSFTSEQKRQLELAKLEEKHEREKRLQRKAIKSLGKPKRPAAAFATWVSSLGLKRGSMQLSEWQKGLVPKWEALPEKERAIFEAKAAKAMNNYKLELQKWEEKMVKLGKHDLVRYGIRINPPKTPETKKSTE